MSRKSKVPEPEALQQGAGSEPFERSPLTAETLPAILNGVDADRLVSDLQEMVPIASVNPFDEDARPGFREKEMAEYYADRLSDMGLVVGTTDVVPGRPNVWGVQKGDGEGPSLMLSGHLDTVGTENYPDAFKARAEDGRVYGRGACDMKAGLAAYLEVARLLRESGIRLSGDLVVTGLADEEHSMIGSRHLGKNGPWADFGIIGEPTDLIICPAHKGQLGFYIRTIGKAVHSSRPEDGVNAIQAMSQVIEAFRGYQAELMTRNAHRLCGHPRSSPNVIHGGTIVSTVADFCELEIDRRTLPGESEENVLKEYRRLLDELSARYPEFQYEISGPTLDVSPLDTPIDNPVVRSVASAYERVMGEEGAIGAFVGGTDAPNLGFPTLVFGPGSIAQAHSINEYVEIDQMVAATKIYLLTALDLLAERIF